MQLCGSVLTAALEEHCKQAVHQALLGAPSSQLTAGQTERRCQGPGFVALTCLPTRERDKVLWQEPC